MPPSSTVNRSGEGKKGAHGYDGAKKLSGRKRHLPVDTQGLVLRVVVHAANIADRDGALLVLEGQNRRFPRLSQLWVDAGYRGRCKDWIENHPGVVRYGRPASPPLGLVPN